MNGAFIALLFRMRHINRWGLMHNTQPENLSVHSFECSILTHFLANIGNVYLEKNYDADKLAAFALFHDATEVLTGDLPTPIKYYSEALKSSYKEMEGVAAENLLGRLPKEMQNVYGLYFMPLGLKTEERRLIKAADKLCAYIKCVQELNAGNREFAAACRDVGRSVEALDCEEAKYFIEHCFEAFSLSLDEINGTL